MLPSVTEGTSNNRSTLAGPARWLMPVLSTVLLTVAVAMATHYAAYARVPINNFSVPERFRVSSVLRVPPACFLFVFPFFFLDY